MVIQGLAGTVSVMLESQGDENAIGFSLSFDPGAFTYESASLGSAGSGATLFANASQASAGRLGFVLALGTGSSFAAGTREVVKVNLRSTAAAAGNYTVAFESQPVPCELSDASAQRLAADYVNGTITVNPLPSLRIALSGTNITLAWPLWAANFGLQAAEGGVSPAAPWTNLNSVPALTTQRGHCDAAARGYERILPAAPTIGSCGEAYLLAEADKPAGHSMMTRVRKTGFQPLLRDHTVVADRQFLELVVFKAEISTLLLIFQGCSQRFPVHQVR